MAKRNDMTLVRFVTRAISDSSTKFFPPFAYQRLRRSRLSSIMARDYAKAALRAVKRGRKRGCR